MKDPNFLYTDGRDVTVTQSVLKIKGSHYYLKGITEFGLALLKPQRIPGIIILILGLIVLAEKSFHFVPVSWYDGLSIPYNYSYSDTTLIIAIVGIVLGLILLVITRRRYAIRIETAEGNKLVVISRSKEYVDQILAAMQKAKFKAATGN